MAPVLMFHLFALAAIAPPAESTASTAVDEHRSGKVGENLSWQVPRECRDPFEKDEASTSDLATCPSSIHLSVTRERGGYVGRQHWKSVDGEVFAVNQPRRSCDEAVATLELQVQIHCLTPPPPKLEVVEEKIQDPPRLPPPPPPHEEVKTVEPTAQPLRPPPCVASIEATALMGYGRDAQAFGRGFGISLGYVWKRWRASVVVGHEQFYHLGRRGDGIDGYAMSLPTLSRGSAQGCFEVVSATDLGALVTMPACVALGLGQIRGGRSGHSEWWSGVEGSLRLVVGSRRPVAFRAGADLVLSLSDGVARSGGFYDQGDLAFRLGAGLELRPWFLSRQHREEARELRQARAQQRKQRRSRRPHRDRAEQGGV